ncbi:nucleoside kinase [Elusimicrobiota bacterium]
MSEEFLLEVETGKKVSYNTKYGAEIYRRSLTLLLQCAISELYPDMRIQIGQSLMKGYFFEVTSEKLPANFIRKVESKMRQIVEQDVRFIKITVDKKRAIDLYKEKKREDKVGAISFLQKDKIELIYIHNFFDFVLAECVASTKNLRTFRLIKYSNGFVLQFPVRGDIMRLPENADRQEKLFEVHKESREWERILGVRHVGDLNTAIQNGMISTLIKVQEAFHEKKIALIADEIKRNFHLKKLIFIAGPSSSGKTTFLKRLGIQIRANGLLPEEISLDNYFVPRSETPRTPDGDCDYECLEALDIKFFSEQISILLGGKEIMLPKYNYKTGKREKSSKILKLKQNSVILIEGIHGLNPELSSNVKDKNKYKVFVSALSQLCIDNDTRIFTSDSRLMRRIIRDRLFRGYSPVDVIKRFPKVRQGEDKYIFPFQDNADIFFNSSLIYEQAVLKLFIETHLKHVRKESDEYYEARRVLSYLDFFLPLSDKEVPQTSILREFIGESGFNY